MAEFWKFVPEISTPYAVLGSLIFAAAAVYAVRERARIKGMIGEKDPDARVKMYRDYLGRFTPDLENATREQKVAIVNTQLRHGLITGSSTGNSPLAPSTLPGILGKAAPVREH